MARTSVDLPLPFGPSSAKISPARGLEAWRRGRSARRARSPRRDRAPRARRRSPAPPPRYASITRGSARTVSGSPSSSRRPPAMTSTGRQRRMTRSRLCSIMSTVRPRPVEGDDALGDRVHQRGFTPAAGSSSSSSRGAVMSARASSSSLRWPPDSTRAGRAGQRAEPHEVDQLARPLPQRALARPPPRRAAASWPRSARRADPGRRASRSPAPSSPRMGAGSGTCAPRRRAGRGGAAARRAGGPPRAIRPAVGRSAPAIRLNTVVLPAPLGPMSPVIVPGRTRKETSSTARWPPKRRVTPELERRVAPGQPGDAGGFACHGRTKTLRSGATTRQHAAGGCR